MRGKEHRTEYMRRVAFQKSRVKVLQRNFEALHREFEMLEHGDYLRLMILETEAISATLNLLYAKLQLKAKVRIRKNQL